MPKREVLFVVHHLTIGGVQKSLISALNAIDYKNNNVTLYVRRNRLVLLPYINKNVTIIVNNDNHHYYRHPRAVYLLGKLQIKSFFNRDVNSVKTKLDGFIRNKRVQFEKEKYFSDRVFDVAIAYNEGYTSEFVIDNITAKKKYMFFQSSIDTLHSVHERIMPQFDAIVVEHKDIKEVLLKWYSKLSSKIIKIIENFTDYHFIRELSKDNSVSFPVGKKIICTCARFSKEKGIDLAIETASILKEKGFEFIWYLVGDGPEKANAEFLVNKHMLMEHIVFAGMQKNPYPYMANCDIYVQPSREEALSIAMLESQMLCAPMVSTRTAGGLAMIQDGVNGVLADINAESLEDKVEKLLVNEDLRLRIKKYLCLIEYSKEEERYRNDWKQLLEC